MDSTDRDSKGWKCGGRSTKRSRVLRKTRSRSVEPCRSLNVGRIQWERFPRAAIPQADEELLKSRGRGREETKRKTGQMGGG